MNMKAINSSATRTPLSSAARPTADCALGDRETSPARHHTPPAISDMTEFARKPLGVVLAGRDIRNQE